MQINADTKFEVKCGHNRNTLGFRGNQESCYRGVAGTSPAPLGSKSLRKQGHGPCLQSFPSCLACWLAWPRLVPLRSSHAEEALRTPHVAARQSLPGS